MILVMGEILFDVFPDARRLGGAPFNFAFHLKQLGFDVRFVSRVGKDNLGWEILDFLDAAGFDTGDIQMDTEHPTGTVNISMHPDGGHAFSIVRNTAYDHMMNNDRIRALARSSWRLFYTGTLIQRSRNNAAVVRDVLANRPPSARCFCDINLRPGCYSAGTITSSLSQADILKVNEEELVEITGNKTRVPDVEEAVEGLMAGYGLEQVILTKGSRGSQWFIPNRSFHSPVPENRDAIKDTVGAGDAYAAMAAAGILKGLTTEENMRLAHEFAGMICETEGAIPEDNRIYDLFKRRLES